MKIAQIVLTRTESGCWKIVIMSLKRTEGVVLVDGTLDDAVEDLRKHMSVYEWEQLTHG